MVIDAGENSVIEEQPDEEIQMMPSSNERPERPGKKASPRKKNKSLKRKDTHHRKNSSNNMAAFEDIRGALREELLSIDFTN